MNRIDILRDYWLRASRETIGIAITFDGPIDNTVVTNLQTARPSPGYEDYCAAIPSIPNTIYIVKPGVTLDDI